MFRWRDFKHGWITGPDSADLRGYKVHTNLDTRYSADETSVRVRPPIDGFADLQNLPNPQDFVFYKMERWHSGISEIQKNTLLVYRSVATSGNKYGWYFYTDAPAGGDGATWTTLEQILPSDGSPDVEILVIKGMVKVCLGTEEDYRILINIIPDGNSRNYCTNSVTISTSGVTGRAAQLSLGAGGELWDGWLWDYGKLYQPWTTPQIDIDVQAVDDPDDFIPLDWSEVSAFTILVAAEYDDPGQMGVCWGYTMPPAFWAAISPNQQLIFNVRMEPAAGYIFSPRIRRFGVYSRVLNTDGSGDTDLARIGSIEINDLPAAGSGLTTVFTIDAAVWQSQTVRSWYGDTEGRPIPEFLTAGGSHDSTIPDATILEEEEKITLRPTGMILSDERVYAWGYNEDDGQTRIKYTELPGLYGNYDVFREEYEMWKGGVKYAIEKLVAWDGRILELHRTGVYFCDGYNEARADRWYIYHADTVGIGVPHAFRKTVAVGAYGVFWANYEGVWRFADDRPVNILTGRLLDEWDDARGDNPYDKATQRTSWDEWNTGWAKSCIGGYNHHRNEYWLAVRGGSGEQDTPFTYSYWIWNEDNPGWKKYTFPGRISPYGMTTDEGTFLIYGPTSIANAPMVAEFEADTDVDYGSETYFPKSTITYILQTQKTGNRTTTYIADAFDLQKTCDADHTVGVLLYVDDNTGHSVLLYVKNHGNIMSFRRLAFSTIRVYLTGVYAGGTRPEIHEFSLDARATRKRRR